MILSYFVILGLLVPVLAEMGEIPLMLGSILLAFFFPFVAYGILRRRFFYVFTCFSFTFAFFLTLLYVFINRDSVFITKYYNFSVFTQSNLEQAINVTVLSLVTMVLVYRFLSSLKIGSKNDVSSLTLQSLIKGAAQIRDLYVSVAAVLSLLLSLFIFFTHTTVIELPYPQQVQSHLVPHFIYTLFPLIALTALLIALSKRKIGALARKSSLFAGRISVLLASVLVLFVAGNRGSALLFIVLAGIAEYVLRTKRTWTALGWSFLYLGVAWVIFQSWAYLRTNLSMAPLDQVASESLRLVFLASEPSSSVQIKGLDLEELWSGQMLFQLLYAIQLVNDGISLNGETFIKLLPQALPSFLDGVLWDRPIDDRWLLGDYFVHFGGFFFLGNAYWNGGMLPTIIFIAVLTTILQVLDYHQRSKSAGLIFRIVYWLWLPVMLTQIAYGIQGLARVLEWVGLFMFFDFVKRRDIGNRVDVQTGQR